MNGQCVCKDGFRGTRCEKVACASNCTNDGICTDSGKCQCAAGYELPDCKCKSCSKACWASAGTQTCDCNGVCQCFPGYFGLTCSQKNCPNPCLNGGSCNSQGICECPKTFSGIQCEINLCLGVAGSASSVSDLCKAQTDISLTTTSGTNSNPTPVTVYSLLITQFKNLYVNELYLDQGTTFATYYKTSNGAIFMGEKGYRNWFTNLADEGSSFSVLEKYQYCRFEATGFINGKGSIMSIFLDSSGVEEYRLLMRWYYNPENDREIGEISLRGLDLVDKSNLISIGFAYLSPINSTFIFHAVYLDSESVIDRIKNGGSSSSFSSLYTPSVSPIGSEEIIVYIIAGVSATFLVIAGAVFLFWYQRKRNQNLFKMQVIEARKKQGNLMVLKIENLLTIPLSLGSSFFIGTCFIHK